MALFPWVASVGHVHVMGMGLASDGIGGVHALRLCVTEEGPVPGTEDVERVCIGTSVALFLSPHSPFTSIVFV